MSLLGNRNISLDELNTFLQEAACVVNNTPLWNVSNHPNDPAPISPSNILTMKDNPNPPPLEDLSEEDLLSYGKLRWKRIAFLSDQFWIRWKNHYVSTLQERRLWIKPNKGISVGDIVLVKSASKRNDWPLGRIVEVRPSSDGLVRRILVKVCVNGGPPKLLERSVRDTVLVVSNSEILKSEAGW